VTPLSFLADFGMPVPVVQHPLLEGGVAHYRLCLLQGVAKELQVPSAVPVVIGQVLEMGDDVAGSITEMDGELGGDLFVRGDVSENRDRPFAGLEIQECGGRLNLCQQTADEFWSTSVSPTGPPLERRTACWSVQNR